MAPDKRQALNHTSPTGTPDLSVVVLCYRGGETIIPFLDQMEAEMHYEGMENYELVLVGNYFEHMNDETPKVIHELAKKNPRVVPVTLKKSGMMGWDAISGFEAASGKAIALIDGDGQMPSRDIVRLYRVLKSGEFDIVKTFRKTRLDGIFRRLVSYWYNRCFRILFPGASFRDVNAKPKIMTREAYEKMDLSCGGWFFDGEIMLEAVRLNLNVAEVPTVFLKNEWRGSFLRVWTVIEFVRELIVYRVKYWFK